METEHRPSLGSDPALRRILDRFEEVKGGGAAPRDEILASWQRSTLDGLRPDRLEVPYAADVDEAGRLSWAAGPVIQKVAEDLEGERVALLLTNQRGQVIDRRAGSQATRRLLDRIQLAPGFLYAEDAVGTNAIGTAIERRAPSRVLGQEHFADALVRMSCTAVPVVDPASGRVIGVVDLTTALDDASPLALALVRRTAWEIEQRLLEDASVEDRVLFEHFLRARRHVRGPLIALNQHTMMVNGAASALVATSDRAMLWEWVLRSLRGLPSDSPEIWSAGGASMGLSCEPLFDGTRLAGALVHLHGPARSAAVSGSPARSGVRGIGKETLTATEHAVADLVMQGLTNREAASRLYLSRHTVDFHLRKIFEKLGVRSRVELTRAILRPEADANGSFQDRGAR